MHLDSRLLAALAAAAALAATSAGMAAADSGPGSGGDRSESSSGAGGSGASGSPRDESSARSRDAATDDNPKGDDRRGQDRNDDRRDDRRDDRQDDRRANDDDCHRTHRRRGDDDDCERPRDRTILRSTLVGSLPNDPVLFGLAPGGAPWVIGRSEARLRANGRLDVRVNGLVIPNPPGDGTPGPVDAVAAAVACNGAVVETTSATPLSDSGDARARWKVALPARCLAPAVLLKPKVDGAVADRYIAVTG